MNRILLADDSPHAQRMGERILREEGYEVVTVTDGETALIRLADVDPDVVLADVFLPRKSGYELCAEIRNDARRRHTRVVLLAGLLEPVDEAEVARVKADAVLKKPLEASAVMAAVRPLAEQARLARGNGQEPPRVAGSILGLASIPVPRPVPRTAPPLPPQPPAKAAPPAPVAPKPAPVATKPAPVRADVDAELVRAAVTVALDRAMPALIDEIAGRVIEALRR